MLAAQILLCLMLGEGLMHASAGPSNVAFTVTGKNMAFAEKKSLTYCKIEAIDSVTGVVTEIGRTPEIRQTGDVRFNPITAVHVFEKVQNIRISIYELAKEEPNKANLWFEIEANLGAIMGARGKVMLPTERNKKDKYISVDAVDLGAKVDMVHIKLSSQNIDPAGEYKTNVVISRFDEKSQKYQRVYLTEAIKAKGNRTWKEMQIPLHQLIDQVPTRSLRFQLRGANKNGTTMFGEFIKPYDEISKDIRTPFQLSIGGQEVNGGFLKIEKFILKNNDGRSFLDQIREKELELDFMVAYDFTGSNGNMKFPDSLHHLAAGDDKNQYILTTNATGDVLEKYDHDNRYQANGFGGARNGVSYSIFGLNEGNPCEAVAGIIAAYKKGLLDYQLSSPTHFAPIVQEASRVASKLDPKKKYLVLLILTDGEMNDLSETKYETIKSSGLPLSIIVVAISNPKNPKTYSEDYFTSLKELDGDDVLLTHREGEKISTPEGEPQMIAKETTVTKRDNVQVVVTGEFFTPEAVEEKYFGNVEAASVAYRAKVLEELPDQVMQIAGAA